jgi:hypothetical protein
MRGALLGFGSFAFLVYFGIIIYVFYLFRTLAMSNKRIAEALEQISSKLDYLKKD